jgi:phage baseplate assembly protein V
MVQSPDLFRLLGDLAREGIVISVDRQAGNARVEFAEGLTTGEIPWLAPRAGKTRIWSPPSVGECVLVLAPEADAARGIIVGSLSSSAHPHPAHDGSTLAEFEDGATISYDPESHALMAYLPDDATVMVVARGGLHFTGDVTVDGDIRATGTIIGDADVVGAGKSLKGHLHKNVQAGAALSGPPQ